MSYCINPDCGDRCNEDNLNYCQECGSKLLIQERYRLIRPLRELSGQHQTEIFEIDDRGTLKILKVLISNHRRLVRLFEQEREILAQLKHLAVSRLDTYFMISPLGSKRKLRCLVMEKIAGENLEQWLKNNGSLTEAMAIDWLQQLLVILTQVHQHRIIHRDLKPSNIMIRPDGKLILIDFGTARKLTTTYVEKLDESNITKVYSSGYTAPEQLQGQAMVQSDMFALGRTFVYLMTGICPDNLPKAQEDRLIWHKSAPQISIMFKNLIDRLLILCPTQRPNKGKVANLLEQIKEQSTAAKIYHHYLAQSWQHPATVILISSVVIASAIVGIRFWGWLQPMELSAYDRLMQLRPIETQDSRLLIITVDEADIQYQSQRHMSLRWSLSDEALAQLLTTIKPYNPRTIGIDIYRDFAVDSDYPNLARELNNNDRLFAVCKVPAPQDGTAEGTPPPPEVPSERIGFSDFVADSGDIIRRQLLHLTPPANSNCTAEYAFSLQLALDYLHKQGIEANFTSAGYLQVGTTIFKPLDRHSGGYQNLDAAGYQILLNYRALNSPTDIAQQIPLRDILSDRDPERLANLIKDRLILIGVVASSSTDDWQTPYSRQSSPAQKQIPGMFIQAQMTSQIISAAVDRRPLIWWWSNTWETVWIWGWSLLGAIIGWYLRRPLLLGSAIAISLLLLFTSCLAAFTHAGWIPLLPPAIALIITATMAILWCGQISTIKKVR